MPQIIVECESMPKVFNVSADVPVKVVSFPEGVDVAESEWSSTLGGPESRSEPQQIGDGENLKKFIDAARALVELLKLLGVLK